jgi:hypothetical protein
MDDRHVLTENLLSGAAVAREAAQVELEPGKVVPVAVNLHAFPEKISSKVPRVKPYEFFIVDDVIVIVRPQDRKIVEVVKK